jgi:hypothetical protein
MGQLGMIGKLKIRWHALCYHIGAVRYFRDNAATEPKAIMPKIENSTIIKYATPICEGLKAKGENWNADVGAALVIKLVLEEMGCVEQLGTEFLDDRKALHALVKTFLTASKNFQDSYLAPTGLMPEVKKSAGKDISEFI